MASSFKCPLSDIQVQMDGIIARGSAHTNQENKVGKHYHDNTNIVFIIEGGCIEKREHSTFERVPADILLLHAGETHETVMADCPTKYLTLDIEPGVLGRYDLNEHLLLSAIQKSPDAKFLMLKIFSEILCNDAFSADSVHMLFLEFATISKSQHRKIRPAWITTIEELLQDRWDEPVSLMELSKVAGVNPITISKHFPAYFACTLGCYMRKLKIERSLSIIKKREASLTSTAYACNFADQSHFIRNFRQFTGLSPLQFRNL